MDEHDEAARLERLWSGTFGDAYLERNRAAGAGREAFWGMIAERCAPASVLEVGCNVGGNLTSLARFLPPNALCGVDVHAAALATARERVPGVSVVRAAARALPFRDGTFDLAFTAGVLIHQPEEALRTVMGQVARCSGRYVLCNEYFAEETTPLPYRGQEGALFKRDYGRLYAELLPELTLVDTGHLDAAQGWDDVTFWLFERRGGPRGATA